MVSLSLFTCIMESTARIEGLSFNVITNYMVSSSTLHDGTSPLDVYAEKSSSTRASADQSTRYIKGGGFWKQECMPLYRAYVRSILTLSFMSNWRKQIARHTRRSQWNRSWLSGVKIKIQALWSLSQSIKTFSELTSFRENGVTHFKRMWMG